VQPARRQKAFCFPPVTIDPITEIVGELAVLQGKIDDLEHLLNCVKANELSHEAAQFFYWETEIPAALIARIFNFKNPRELLRSVNTRQYECGCAECGEAVPCSRAALKSKLLLCSDCRSKQVEERIKLDQQHLAKHMARFEELRSMPYVEYLQTQHWQDLRHRKLKSSSYRCQICNASDKTLDVHHRSYENRGCEQWSDTIVVCRDCHERFHFGGDNGKV